MPTFVLNTNLSRSTIPDVLAEELTMVLAQELGKPKKYIAVHIVPDQILHFGGSSEPCALGSLSSIGKIGSKQNKTYTKVLFDLVNKHLHISPDRMYIVFQDLEPANVGFNSNTFA
ncbi:macrophage migration inhibitory factor [Scyliorhinus canicula]|uniref:macrophage migration inhibitory factor n=1 Tax=Scyliorhinus canicula TaxID=7830 RepID=UPI0018F700B9|nr:macrophage migration inhibitory factor [Scyliorhinus canicula]